MPDAPSVRRRTPTRRRKLANGQADSDRRPARRLRLGLRSTRPAAVPRHPPTAACCDPVWPCDRRQPAIVTIGNFDGVHLGHQKLDPSGGRPGPRPRAVQPGGHVRAPPRAGAVPRTQADPPVDARGATRRCCALAGMDDVWVCPFTMRARASGARGLHAPGHRAAADRGALGRRRLCAGPRAARDDRRAGRNRRVPWAGACTWCRR